MLPLSALMKLFQVPVANGPAGVRRLFGLPDCFLKLLLQQVGSMLLGLDRLAKYRVTPAVLLFHGTRSGLYISKRLGLYRGSMRNNRFGLAVHLQYGAAAGAGDIEVVRFLYHDGMILQTASARFQLDGENMHEIEELPSQQNDGDDYHHYGEHFPETHARTVRLKTPGH
jgi:hypothetical protein